MDAPIGLFHLSYDLIHAPDTHPIDQQILRGIREWFDDHLEAPDAFNTYSRGNHPDIAVCWFRDNARRHIAKMWETAWLLERNGQRVHFLKTRRPGIVVYEDDYQVAAVPFRDQLSMPLP